MSILLNPRLKDCRCIFFEEIKCMASIGIHPHELSSEQEVVIWIEIYIDLINSQSLTDSIEDTLDYDEINSKVKFIVNTKNVFLEVALFDPSQVAKTGRKLGINSDARYRFERGLDKEMIEEGLEYASYLINKICGGSVSKNTSAGKLDKNNHVIDYNFNYFQKVIGLHLSSEVQIKILKSLLFQVLSRFTPTQRDCYQEHEIDLMYLPKSRG